MPPLLQNRERGRAPLEDAPERGEHDRAPLVGEVVFLPLFLIIPLVGLLFAEPLFSTPHESEVDAAILKVLL